LLPAFFTYFRPRWHPWQRDNSHEIERWMRDNAPRYVEPSAQPTPSNAA
jgi:predicted metal-dependent hydrolase